MKTRYIFVSMVAALALVTGCVKEETPSLSDIQATPSFVGVPMQGGSANVVINASQSWSVTSSPDWITVSPASGSAGQVTITVSAGQIAYGRASEIVITCGSETQHINVTQGVVAASDATCAEVNAGPDGKTFRVTGVCTAIANTSYGNWYLTDETGTVYIYGTVDDTGNYKWSSFNIEVGDVVTVEGPKTTYNGTVELVDAKFIKVVKSLVKIEAVEDADVASEGGEAVVKLTSKVGSIAVDIPAEAKEWLSIAGIQVVPGTPDPSFPDKAVADTSVVTFNVAQNASKPRSAVVTFSSTANGQTSSVTAQINQDGAAGTLEVPFTVTEAISYMLKRGSETTTDYYVKGIVSKIEVDKNGVSQEFGAEYGNATFWISEDGEFHGDKSLDFEGYRVLWLGNNKWAEGNAQIEVGAEVLLCGKLTVYNGTAETSGGKAYVYRVNGVTSDAEGIGTQAAPFTAPGAVVAAKSGTAASVFVTGTIASILNNGSFSAQYGNASFWISKDGSYNDDKSVEFEAFRVLYLGNRKWEEGDTQIAVGDKVVLYGPLTTYGETSETVQNKAYIYSLNGKTE